MDDLSGYWGAGSFDNGAAVHGFLDLTERVKAGADGRELLLKILRAPFVTGQQWLGAKRCAELIGACELVAGALGHSNTFEASEFVATSGLHADPSLIRAAKAVLDLILSGSELQRDYDSHPPSAEVWRGHMTDLRKRLDP